MIFLATKSNDQFSNLLSNRDLTSEELAKQYFHIIIQHSQYYIYIGKLLHILNLIVYLTLIVLLFKFIGVYPTYIIIILVILFLFCLLIIDYISQQISQKKNFFVNQVEQTIIDSWKKIQYEIMVRNYNELLYIQRQLLITTNSIWHKIEKDHTLLSLSMHILLLCAISFLIYTVVFFSQKTMIELLNPEVIKILVSLTSLTVEHLNDMILKEKREFHNVRLWIFELPIHRYDVSILACILICNILIVITVRIFIKNLYQNIIEKNNQNIILQKKMEEKYRCKDVIDFYGLNAKEQKTINEVLGQLVVCDLKINNITIIQTMLLILPVICIVLLFIPRWGVFQLVGKLLPFMIVKTSGKINIISLVIIISIIIVFILFGVVVILLNIITSKIYENILNYITLQKDAQELKSLFELMLKYKLEPKGKIKSSLHGPIIFTNAKYTIGTKIIFKNANFIIPQGSRVLIVGKEGSGKSKIMHLLSGLFYGYEGSISINNTEISDLNLKHWRSNILFCNQTYTILHDTMENNIALKLPIQEHLINYAMQLSAIDHLALERLTDQISDVSLSGGEQQRVALARFFYHYLSLEPKPAICFLDEPLSALDPKNRVIITNNLYQIINQDSILFLVDHTLTPLKLGYCDLILYIDDKDQSVTCGTPQEVYMEKQGFRELCDKLSMEEKRKNGLLQISS